MKKNLKFIILLIFFILNTSMLWCGRTLYWTGNDNDNWRNMRNWKTIPASIIPITAWPNSSDDIIIDDISNHSPKLYQDVFAKTVTINSNMELNLDGFRIFADISKTKTSKIINEGTLKLQGSGDQNSWFNAANDENKIHLYPGSTVEYISGSASTKIWIGEYYNLRIDKIVDINFDIAIKENLTNNGTFTSTGKLIFKGTDSILDGLNEITVAILEIADSGGTPQYKLEAESDITINNKFICRGKFKSSETVTFGNKADVVITVESGGTAEFNHLYLENSRHTLGINGNINIEGDLKLSGEDEANRLTINQYGEITLAQSQIGNGKFLKVHTANVQIKPDGTTYTISKSVDNNNKTVHANGWIFRDSLELTWDGSVDTDWLNPSNWIPQNKPELDTIIIIPGGKTRFPKLSHATECKALSVKVEENAELDLAGFTVQTASGTAKLENKGTIKLTGTAAQKDWFENINLNHRLKLIGNTTVEYYGNNNADIYNGSYYNLKIKDDKTISSTSSINVSNDCIIDGNVTLQRALDLKNITINSSKRLTANKDIRVNGNFTNNGTFISSEKVVFTGATSVLSGSGSNQFFNLVLLTNSGSNTYKLDLESNIKVEKSIVSGGDFTGTKTVTFGNSHDIEIRKHAGTMTFNDFVIVNSDKRLEIIDDVFLQGFTVKGSLRLSGKSETNRLIVDGLMTITLENEQTKKGAFLHVNTDHVKFITNDYKIINSVDNNNQHVDKNGWVFINEIQLTWEGTTNNDWLTDSNWNPVRVPDEDCIITIPSGKPRFPKLADATEFKAFSVKVEENATLDLADLTIQADAETAKLENNGTIRLMGTADQKAWFENGTAENKLTLSGNSTVEYYGNIDADIYGGNYYNLKIENTKTISSTTAITVLNDFVVDGNVTLRSVLDSKNITVNNTKILRTNQNIKLNGNFTNNGEFNSSADFTLAPSGDEIIISCLEDAEKTVFTDLVCENAGGKTLTFNKKLKIIGNLELTGSSESNLLKIRGVDTLSEIVFDSDKSGGKFLEVYTNIPIKEYTYTTTKSKAVEVNNLKIEEGNPKNWIFDDCISGVFYWSGSVSTDWETPKNWLPYCKPNEKADLVIKQLTIPSPRYPKIDADNLKAKTINVKAGAQLDLAGFTIQAASGTAKLENSGTIQLTGTAAQKAWFENGTAENKFTLSGNSIVEYYGSGSANIYSGDYYNLKIKDNKTIASDKKIKVTNNCETHGTIDTEINAKNCISSGTTTLKKKSEIDGNFAANADTSILADMIVSNITVAASKIFTVNANVQLRKSLTNNGKFKSTGNLTLNHSGDEIKITGTADISDTECKNLICENSGNKKITFIQKTKIVGDLKLTGSSNTAFLNIDGNGEIHLQNSQKDKAQYVKVNTETLKINNGDFTIYYILKESKDFSNSERNRNGWIFYKEFTLLNSFVIPETNRFYIVFNGDYPDNEFEKATLQFNKVNKPFSSAVRVQANVWCFDMIDKITQAMVITKGIEVDLINFEYKNSKTNISDVGFNLINVLYAANSKVIRIFDGTMKLPKLNTNIVTATTLASEKVKLHFYKNQKKFWYPEDITVPNYSQGVKGASVYTGVIDSGKINFLIPYSEKHLVEDSSAEFMFVYDNWLPCAYLKNNSTNIFSNDEWDVWRFIIGGTKLQRGGVSIFNNAVNPEKDENVTLQINLEKPGMLTVQVMTLEGSIVATLNRSQKNAGAHLFYWDGKNASGRVVARGMYFIRIVGPEIDEIRKVLVVK